ncbi:MAG: DUF2142 domain-containing protein [Luteitalea sp.]|nr:DUF2142 domain-containing protein [Luteitalea sp.]
MICDRMFRLSRAPIVGALLFALGGAAFGAAELSLTSLRQPIYRDFYYQRDADEGFRRFAYAHSAIYIHDLGCGPLDTFVRVRSGSRKLRLDVRLAASGRTLADAQVREPAQWINVRVPDTDGARGIERLDLYSEVPPNPWGFAAVVDDVRANAWAPCRAAGRITQIVARRAVGGVIVGLLLWTLVWPVMWHRWLFGAAASTPVWQPGTTEGSDAATGAKAGSWNLHGRVRANAARLRAHLVTWAALFVLFGSWAVIRPPLQSPDEVDHFARVLSMARQPWVAFGEEVRLPGGLLTPFVLRGNEPVGARKLMFDGEAQLTRSEITDLKRSALGFTAADDDHVLSHAWAYPPAYYLPVFLVGRALTGGLALSPYDAFYAYRLASAALSALLWVLVARALGGVFTRSGDRRLAFLLMVSTPMVTFLASSVNADAAMLPLSVLATLLVWDLARNGRGHLQTFVVLLALALSKPAAVVVILSLAAALILTTVVRRSPDLPAGQDATLVCVRAMAVAYVVYYAWVSPHLLGVPLDLSPTAYLELLPRRASFLWAGFWGHLGWLDYRLEWGWYVALAVLCVMNAGYYLADRSRRYSAFAWFAVISAVSLGGALLAAEYLTLSRVGLTLQGRYFLPALPALAVLLMHRGQAVRLAFVVLVIVCHLVLVDVTARRYYVDDWRGVVAALPYY